MLGFSLCCFLSFTVWVTPENGIAKRQLRYSSVLTQDSRSLQTVSLLSSPVAPQILCIGPLSSSSARVASQRHASVGPTTGTTDRYLFEGSHSRHARI